MIQESKYLEPGCKIATPREVYNSEDIVLCEEFTNTSTIFYIRTTVKR